MTILYLKPVHNFCPLFIDICLSLIYSYSPLTALGYRNKDTEYQLIQEIDTRITISSVGLLYQLLQLRISYSCQGVFRIRCFSDNLMYPNFIIENKQTTTAI